MEADTAHPYLSDVMEARMEAAGVDALVATTAPNVQYLTRYRRPGAALALLQRGRPDPFLVLPTIELDFCLEDMSSQLTVKAYGAFPRVREPEAALTEREQFVADHHESRDPDADRWGTLAALVDELGLFRATIGVDATPALVPQLGAALPDAALVDVSTLFRAARSVKSPFELARLKEAARITDQAIVESAAVAAVGVTQRQIARTFAISVARADATLRSNNVGVGYGSALGNANIPDTAVEVGSVIRYDVGCFYRGYSTDVARTFAFLEASSKVRDYYAALLHGQQAALEVIRPGVTARRVFEVAMEAVHATGIPHYERLHVGHGIGIAGAGYDQPLLGPKDGTVLEPGMVLCVETPYIELGFAGLQVEDMIVVTETGFDYLTHSDRSLRILP